MNNTENVFKIDFFELSFLVEACIPPVPIARISFWHRVIDEIYYELSDDQRANLFKWIGRNGYFQDMLKQECGDTHHFYNRFNPKNQYRVWAANDGKLGCFECYKHYDEYHTKRTRSIPKEFITKIEKI